MFDMKGNVVKKRGGKFEHGTEPGKFRWPTGLALDNDRNIVIADRENYRVQILTSDLDFITAFGEQGKEPGCFGEVYAVCVDAWDRIYVGDTNGRVQVFAFGC